MLSDAITPEIKTQQQIIEEAQTRLGRLETLQDDCKLLADFVQKVRENLDVLSGEAVANLKSSLLAMFDGSKEPFDNNAPGEGRDARNGASTPHDNIPSDDNVLSYDLMAAEESEQAVIDGDYQEFLADPEEGNEDIDLTYESKPTAQQDYIELARVSDRVSYFRRQDGVILAVYAGFSSKQRAESWGRWLVDFTLAGGFQVRPAKRLSGFKHELKIWGMSFVQIEQFAESDLTRNPGIQTAERFPDAKKRERELFQVEEPTHSEREQIIARFVRQLTEAQTKEDLLAVKAQRIIEEISHEEIEARLPEEVKARVQHIA